MDDSLHEKVPDGFSFAGELSVSFEAEEPEVPKHKSNAYQAEGTKETRGLWDVAMDGSQSSCLAVPSGKSTS